MKIQDLESLCATLIQAHDRMDALVREATAATEKFEATAVRIILAAGTIRDERGNVLRSGIDKIVCGDRLIELDCHGFCAFGVRVRRANVVLLGHPALLEHKVGAA